jgi:hypothetical protein
MLFIGKSAIEEIIENNKRTITFSPILRELGHHIHGEIWATKIKEVLKEKHLLSSHPCYAAMHSDEFYLCHNCFKTKFKDKSDFFIYEELQPVRMK